MLHHAFILATFLGTGLYRSGDRLRIEQREFEPPAGQLESTDEPVIEADYQLRMPGSLSLESFGGSQGPVDGFGAFSLRTLAAMNLDSGLVFIADYAGFRSDSPQSLAATTRTSIRSTTGEVLERGSSVDDFDFTLAVRAVQSGPVTLSVLSGVHGISLDQPSGTNPRPPLSLTPMAGAGAAVAVTDGWTLSGRSTVGPSRSSSQGPDLAITLSTAFKISATSSLVIEYQRSRASINTDGFKGDLKRDAVAVQFKLSF